MRRSCSTDFGNMVARFILRSLAFWDWHWDVSTGSIYRLEVTESGKIVFGRTSEGGGGCCCVIRGEGVGRLVIIVHSEE
jgi:hypothetical protein